MTRPLPLERRTYFRPRFSRDGQRIALDTRAGMDGEIWVYDVATATPPLRWVAYSGSWVGNHIVAPASAGLAVFAVGDASLELEQVLSLDPAQFPTGVQEPRFTDDAGNEIAAVADLPPASGDGGTSFLLQCDRVARTCETSCTSDR